MILTEENWSTRIETCLIDTSFTTNPTRTGRNERPTTDRLKHDTILRYQQSFVNKMLQFYQHNSYLKICKSIAELIILELDFLWHKYYIDLLIILTNER